MVESMILVYDKNFKLYKLEYDQLN